MDPSPVPDIVVRPCPNDAFICSGTFGERINPRVLKALRISNLIPRDFAAEDLDNHSLGAKRSRQTWNTPNPMLAFLNYCQNMDANGFRQVKLFPSKKNPHTGGFYGRVYGPMLGLFENRLKVTLASPWPEVGWKGLVDIDMVNAHPSILYQFISGDPAIRPECYTALREIVENRDTVLADIMRVYGVDRKLAKRLILRPFFGGTTGAWFSEFREQLRAGSTLAQMPQSIKDLEAELKTHIEHLKKKNPQLWETTRRAEQQKAARNGAYENVLGSFLARWSQSMELKIVATVLEVLVNQTTLCDVDGRKVCFYEFDGIKFDAEALEVFLAARDWEISNLLEYISDIVFETLRICITFAVKEIELADRYDITPFFDKETECNTEQIKQFIFELGNPSVSAGIALSSQRGIADFIINHQHPKEFVFYDDKWYCWDTDNNKWVCYMTSKTAYLLDRAVLAVDAYLRERMRTILMAMGLNAEPEVILAMSDVEWAQSHSMLPKEELFPLISKMNTLVRDVQKNLASHTFNQGVVGISRTVAHSDSLKFNTNGLLLGFPNGVYDFTDPTRPQFRDYTKEDLSTLSCDVPYTEPVQADVEMLESILVKIFPDPELLEYVMEIFATGLLGVGLEHFYVLNGGGGNGKGLLNGLMKTLLGAGEDGYCMPNFPPALMCANLESNAPYPDIAKLHNKRWVTMAEPPTGKRFVNSTMRALTGGNDISARDLYSSSKQVTIHATWNCECNERPKMMETPKNADMRRLFDIPFSSTFTEKEADVNPELHIYLADPTFKLPEIQKRLAIALFHRLSPLACKFITNEYKIKDVPDVIRERTLQYCLESFEVLSAFRTYYYHDAAALTAGFETTFDKILQTIKTSETWEELGSSKAYFKKDVFSNNLAEVIQLTFGRSRVKKEVHPRTNKPFYSVIGFLCVNDE